MNLAVANNLVGSRELIGEYMSRNTTPVTLVAALFVAALFPTLSHAAVVVNAGSDSAGPDVLVYSNDRYTDEDQEDLDITNALLSISKTVSVFDGGDGTRAAWESALSGIEVLVIPEGSPWQGGNTVEGFDAQAKSFVLDWVKAGRTVIGTGSYTHRQMITDWTGVDFTSVGNGRADSSWSLVVSRAGLPSTIPNANYAGGITNYNDLTQQQKDAMEVIYYDPDYNSGKGNVGVASFAVGSGFYIYNAYDWYPGGQELTNGVRAAWNQTLQFGATGAITGVSTTVTAEPIVETPRPYMGPLFESGPRDVKGDDVATYSGRRLDQISSVELEGRKLSFSATADSITVSIPVGIKFGTFDLIFYSPNGKLTFMNALVVRESLFIEKVVEKTLLIDPNSSPQSIRDQLRRLGKASGLDLSAGLSPKMTCLVNPGKNVIKTTVEGLCSTVAGAFHPDVRAQTSSKTSYSGEGIWIRVWSKATFAVNG